MNTERLTPDEAILLAGDAVGDVIEHWGFRKALGRIWTILYLSTTPLTAADLAERLQMSAGAVSISVNELRRWGVVERVWRPGERKEFFEAETDFWKMISRVVRERERELASSVRERLERAVAAIADGPRTKEAKEVQTRLRRLLSLAAIAGTLIDSFIASQTVSFSELGNLLSFGRSRDRGA